MIFKPELAAKVLDGTKTMTRRPTRHEDGKCPHRVGKTLAVQPGRGKRHVAHLRVVRETRHEALHEITERDARKEGFANVAEFLAYWRSLYGEADPMQPVCVIEFDVLRLGCCPREGVA